MGFGGLNEESEMNNSVRYTDLTDSRQSDVEFTNNKLLFNLC